MLEEEKKLVLKIQKGDTVAFDKLFKGYYPHLFRFLISMLNNKDAANDLLQDLFLKVWRNKENLNPEKSIKSYLFYAAKNLSLNYFRDKRKKERITIPLGEENLSPDNKNTGRMEKNFITQSAEELYIQNSLQNELHKALQSLPERSRIAFYLSRYEELSHAEIAEIMKISPKTVNNLIMRALELLRKCLRHLYLND